MVNSTRVGAAGVLGGLIGMIVTVKLSIALPFLLVEAAAVSAAELIRTTCWILCHINTRYELTLITAVHYF